MLRSLTFSSTTDVNFYLYVDNNSLGTAFPLYWTVSVCMGECFVADPKWTNHLCLGKYHGLRLRDTDPHPNGFTLQTIPEWAVSHCLMIPLKICHLWNGGIKSSGTQTWHCPLSCFLSLVHTLWSPFLKMGTITPVCHSKGTAPVVHAMLNRCVG